MFVIRKRSGITEGFGTYLLVAIPEFVSFLMVDS